MLDTDVTLHVDGKPLVFFLKFFSERDRETVRVKLVIPVKIVDRVGSLQGEDGGCPIGSRS